jgi:hypothetical protein
VKLAEHEASDERGTGHWLADYTFSTGRRMHNEFTPYSASSMV